MDDIVIVSAVRTPVGSFNGALGTLPAHTLGAIALQAAFERAGVTADDVDEVILGQVLTAGEGQNPARQAGRAAGSTARAWPARSLRWSRTACCAAGCSIARPRAN